MFVHMLNVFTTHNVIMKQVKKHKCTTLVSTHDAKKGSKRRSRRNKEVFIVETWKPMNIWVDSKRVFI